MTEIMMLVWLGDVAHNVSFLLGLLLAGCVLVAAMWALVDVYEYDYARACRRVWPAAVGATILALALALIPSKDTIYLYAAARAVQIAETTELGSEVYAALLRSLRGVSPAK
jgi:uncharacterized membrane protein